MNKNKSSVYGYFGGVTNPNHYVPPESQPFIPHPPKAAFTAEDKAFLEQLKGEIGEAAVFIQTNAADILLRKNTESAPGNIDTFVMSTLGKPEDTITYTSSKDDVVLSDIAGTGITNPDNIDEDSLDGGTF